MASSVSEQGWRALVLGLTFLFAAPEVPAKAVWVAPEDAVRSLGMVALGDSSVLWPGCYTWGSSKAPAPLFSSPLKSCQMVTREADRVYLGQLEISQVQFQRAWPVILVF